MGEDRFGQIHPSPIREVSPLLLEYLNNGWTNDPTNFLETRSEVKRPKGFLVHASALSLHGPP